MKTMQRILIIEDDLEICAWIKEKLDRSCFTGSVSWVDTISGALETLEKNVPDAIILDLTLPDGNGIEILRKIKIQKLSVKVYVFSVNTSMEKVCLRMGAEGFFDKSSNGEQLIEILVNETS